MGQTVRDTNFCVTQYTQGKGYAIRLKSYPDTSFTITETGELEVRQTAKTRFDFASWNLLQQEIAAGYQYMSQRAKSGTPAKAECIKPKDLIPGAIYRTSSGKLYWWIGKGTIKKSLWRDVYGEGFIYADLSNIATITSVSVYMGNCFIKSEGGDFELGLRGTRPANLVELVWKPTNYFFTITHNNKSKGSWE